MFKRVQKCVILVFSFVLIFQSLTLEAQSDKSLFEKVNRSMSFQDKVWAVQNIKSVKKALSISDRVMNTMDSLYKSGLFETNVEGSRYDAFRHVFWMYSLACEIGIPKSRRIGLIYENYNQYVFETTPLSGYDFAGREMDEYNNEVGLNLFSRMGKQENSIVFDSISSLISKGCAKIIAKDKSQRSLDREGRVICDSLWKSQWNNDRYLINSNVEL